MTDTRNRWTERSADVDGGRLEWTVFPGPEPFVGSTRLDGRPIAPADAHGLLVELGHDDAALAFMGQDWVAGVGARRAM